MHCLRNSTGLGILASVALAAPASASYLDVINCLKHCSPTDSICQWQCIGCFGIGMFEMSTGFAHAGGGKKYLNLEGHTAATLHYLPGDGLPHGIEAVTFRLCNSALGPEGRLLGIGEVVGDGTYELVIDLTDIPLGGVIVAEIHYSGVLDIADFGCIVCTAGETSVPCVADFDSSGFVDLDDYVVFVGAFEQGNVYADFDGSGFVDTDDFTAFVLAFEAGC